MKSSLRLTVQIALVLCVPLSITGCKYFKKASSSTSPTETLQTVTLMGGSGYIFDGAQTTSGLEVDRDIWWNNASVVPSHSGSSIVTMCSLGQVADLTAVTDLKIETMTSDERFPQTGEAFALEIRRPFDGAPKYALIRVTSITAGGANGLTFQFVYPR
jgi:hypothetical protein